MKEVAYIDLHVHGCVSVCVCVCEMKLRFWPYHPLPSPDRLPSTWPRRTADGRSRWPRCRTSPGRGGPSWASGWCLSSPTSRARCDIYYVTLGSYRSQSKEQPAPARAPRCVLVPFVSRRGPLCVRRCRGRVRVGWGGMGMGWGSVCSLWPSPLRRCRGGIG